MQDVSGVRKLAVEYLLPAVIGGATAVAIYRLLLPLLPDDSSFRTKLTERGFIPFLCMWLLLWELTYLILHYFLRIHPDMALLRADIVPAGVAPLTQEDIDAMRDRLAELESPYGSSRLARRILLTLNLQKQDAGLSVARHVHMKDAEAELARVEAVYGVPNFLVWAMPILGFIGTVLGIGRAVGNIGVALKDVQDVDAVSAALGMVSEGLGVAFDTTLVALWMCILGMIMMTVVKRVENSMLADVEGYVSLRLLSRLRFESPVEKLSKEVRELCSRVDGMLGRTR